MQLKEPILIKLVFVVALGLRLFLSLYNREANDDHMQVINLIVDKGIIPEKDDCAECFQPKLFYSFHAQVIKTLHINSIDGRIVYVQLTNLFLSFFILLIVLKLIQSVKASSSVRVVSFSFLAFNPCLTGINVQATNDTMTILFGACCIYFTTKFLEEKKISQAIWLIFFIVLASVIKGSGLVIFVAVFFILLLTIIFLKGNEKIFLIKTLFALTFFYMAIVPFAGGYYKEFKNSGTPFATGIGPAARSAKPDESFRYRPGITSVAGGYLTFRYWDMLRQPYITDDPDVYPLHRTSLWSQLYGRTFFMHFDQHPPSWQSTSIGILNVGRMLLALGIIPVIVFLIGFVKSATLFFKNLITSPKNYFSSNNDWIHLAFICGYVLFIIKYSRDFPDFSTMKSVFLFPAIPSFLIIFTQSLAEIKNILRQKVAIAILTTIIFFSICDICFLIKQLA